MKFRGQKLYNWNLDIDLDSIGKVGVIYGGWSNERNISLASGASVLNACKIIGLDVVGFDITSVEDVYEMIKHDVDIFLIALHGGFGEDGHLQAILDLHDINYVGSQMLASANCMNKSSSRLICQSAGIPVMPWQSFSADCLPKTIKFDFPLCLKPESGGSSLGVKKINDFDEWLRVSNDLEPGMWMLEPWIKGKDQFVGIVADQALPVLEVRLPDGEFFDYENKYSKGSKSAYATVENLTLQDYSLKAFKVLGCKDYARADFVVRGNQAWFLEMNTLPGMSPNSTLPMQARVAGLKHEEFLLQVLYLNSRELAL